MDDGGSWIAMVFRIPLGPFERDIVTVLFWNVGIHNAGNYILCNYYNFNENYISNFF